MDANLIVAVSKSTVYAAIPTPAAPPRLRILIADDSPVDRRLAQSLLQRLGLGADVVSDGSAATLAVLDKEYDVILMDILMPHLDGIAAAKRILQRPASARQARPAVVAMTGDPMLASPERCRDAGMVGFLAKPLRIEQLVAILRAAEEARRP